MATKKRETKGKRAKKSAKKLKDLPVGQKGKDTEKVRGGRTGGYADAWGGPP